MRRQFKRLFAYLKSLERAAAEFFGLQNEQLDRIERQGAEILRLLAAPEVVSVEIVASSPTEQVTP